MKKNTKNKLIVFIFILSLIVFLFAFYLNYSATLKKEEIIATLIIGNKTGFDLNATALTFGRITPNSNLQRNLIIKNNYNFPIKVKFDAKGEIKKFLVFDKAVHLKKGEEKNVAITAISSVNSEYGNYSGKIIVITKKDI